MTDSSTVLPQLSWPDVWGRRLDRHGLSAFVRGRPADAVAAMCGAHAQVLSAAEVSIGLRIAGTTRTDVQHALWGEGSLVKTFGPRGTVHLLPTRELPLWTGALGALPPSSNGMPADARLTPDQTDEVVAAIAGALADGVRLLPYFDAYTVGCHPRERLFPGPATQRALSGGQAGNFPVLLVDGTVAGIWHHRRTRHELNITVEPLTTLTIAARRELDDQVKRIGEILEAEPRLTIGPVTLGGHA